MARRVDNKKQYRMLWIIIAVILCVTFAAAAVLFALNYVDSGVDPVSEMRAKNVILLIGDGMGFNHIKAGNIYSGSRLQMERFAVSGEVMTRSLTPGATDSAAAATAMATGIKTYNGRIAYKDGKNLTTVAEMAMAEGKKVGVVVTKAVTDATPAAFLTHASDRGETQSIAEQLVNSDVDVLFGLGDEYMYALADSIATDEREYCTTFQTIADAVQSSEKEKIFGLLKDGSIQNFGANTLAQLTRNALTKLSAEADDGFFLMVEGSKIDSASHDNDMQAMLNELQAFNATVSACKEWAAANGDTVVIVTADHETGGLKVPDIKDASEAYDALLDFDSSDKWFTKTGHTSVNVGYYIYATSTTPIVGSVEAVDNNGDIIFDANGEPVMVDVVTGYAEIDYSALMDIPEEIDNTDIFELIKQWLLTE